MINRLTLVSIFLCLAATAMTRAMATEQSLRPGGIAIVEVGSIDNTAPTVTLQGKPLLVMQRENQWVAVAGIALDTEPRRIEISVNGESAPVDISGHDYREQRITDEMPSASSRCCATGNRMSVLTPITMARSSFSRLKPASSEPPYSARSNKSDACDRYK